MTIRAFEGAVPELGTGAHVDPTAVVIGRVVLGDGSSVWPQAVIRGDTESIRVGARSNVQDGSVLHADPGVPCTIGQGVTIGHRAVVHGCQVGDDVLIGMGAVVMNGAVIGAQSIVGAGALVTERTDVPPGSLVLGAPARVIRATTRGERDAIRASAARYVAMAARHRAGADPV
jgi:carbonic anhydrase/acetyltransferase-like protein (isoleucine patch superfamily)